jgi:uncharacterized protein YkwD
MRRSLALAVLAPLLAVAACSAGPETTKGAPTGTGAGRPSSSTTTGPSVSTTSATTTAVTATAMPRATTARPSATSRSATRLRVTPKPAPSTVKPKPKPKPSPPPAGVAGQVLSLVNAERAKAGCNAVRSNSALTRAAQGHSADMAAHDYFSHTSKDGRTFSQRIRAAGYSGGTIGENIAAGQSSASAVMRSWMGSSGHRANILNCRFTALGVGYARGGGYGYYWTQDFGG